MIVSVENKYIYIAVPKTGTTTVEQFLLEVDKSAKSGGFSEDDKVFKLRGHSTAYQAVKVIKEDINKFKLFGFVRYPLSRLVSSYNFYRKGGKNDRFTKNRLKRYLHWLQIKFARGVPFVIWIFIYPYKSNVEYFVDNQNKVIVDFIGVYEKLNSDLDKFFKSINLNFNFNKLPIINQSGGSNYNSLLSRKLVLTLLKLRHPLLAKDLAFYDLVFMNKVSKGMVLRR